MDFLQVGQARGDAVQFAVNDLTLLMVRLQVGQDFQRGCQRIVLAAGQQMET